MTPRERAEALGWKREWWALVKWWAPQSETQWPAEGNAWSEVLLSGPVGGSWHMGPTLGVAVARALLSTWEQP